MEIEKLEIFNLKSTSLSALLSETCDHVSCDLQVVRSANWVMRLMPRLIWSDLHAGRFKILNSGNREILQNFNLKFKVSISGSSKLSAGESLWPYNVYTFCTNIVRRTRWNDSERLLCKNSRSPFNREIARKRTSAILFNWVLDQNFWCQVPLSPRFQSDFNFRMIKILASRTRRTCFVQPHRDGETTEKRARGDWGRVRLY